MRDFTIFYRSFYEAIKELPSINQSEIYNAIFEYSFNFKEVDLQGLSKTIFTLIRPQLDANIDKYKTGLKHGHKGAEFGKLGGRPLKINPQITLTKPSNVNVNDNDNVNDNVNKIEERKLKFSNSLKPFLDLYGKELLNSFYKYWTEPNKSNTKFRMELEKTWSTERRLETWVSREKTFTKDPIKNIAVSTNNLEGKKYIGNKF